MNARQAKVYEFAMDREYWYDLKGDGEVPISCGSIMMAP